MRNVDFLKSFLSLKDSHSLVFSIENNAMIPASVANNPSGHDDDRAIVVSLVALTRFRNKQRITVSCHHTEKSWSITFLSSTTHLHLPGPRWQ